MVFDVCIDNSTALILILSAKFKEFLSIIYMISGSWALDHRYSG